MPGRYSYGDQDSKLLSPIVFAVCAASLPPLGGQTQFPGAFSLLRRPGPAHLRPPDRSRHAGSENYTPGYDIPGAPGSVPRGARLFYPGPGALILFSCAIQYRSLSKHPSVQLYYIHTV